MTLDPAGLEAAAKVLAFRDLAADPDWHGVYEEEWAAQPEEYREAWRESVREVLAPYLAAVVPVTPTTENPPENVYARLRNRPPEPSAAVAWDEGYVAGFAAGRAAATPDAECPERFPLTGGTLEAVLTVGDIREVVPAPAATPDPPDGERIKAWECCGVTFTGTSDFISGVRAAHICKRQRKPITSDEYAESLPVARVGPNATGANEPAAATPDPPSDRNIARMFHEAYERLAPEFGYRTREESAVPWEKVPAKNRDLMTATVGAVRAHLAAASPDERLREALAFYADKGNYTAQNPVGSGAHVWRDMGGRARKALAAADRDTDDAAIERLGNAVIEANRRGPIPPVSDEPKEK